MSRRLKTTYSLIGLNGRALPAAPPPPPQPEQEPDAEYSSDDDEDPRYTIRNAGVGVTSPNRRCFADNPIWQCQHPTANSRPATVLPRPASGRPLLAPLRPRPRRSGRPRPAPFRSGHCRPRLAPLRPWPPAPAALASPRPVPATAALASLLFPTVPPSPRPAMARRPGRPRPASLGQPRPAPGRARAGPGGARPARPAAVRGI
nr:uncharacterized protein LOC127310095 [Lolium perenne]